MICEVAAQSHGLLNGSALVFFLHLFLAEDTDKSRDEISHSPSFSPSKSPHESETWAEISGEQSFPSNKLGHPVLPRKQTNMSQHQNMDRAQH